MVQATVLAHQKFVDQFRTFLTYTQYLQQWAQSVNTTGAALAADPLFPTALSSAEQTAINSLVTASGNIATALGNITIPQIS